jgi:hypothetical protein
MTKPMLAAPGPRAVRRVAFLSLALTTVVVLGPGCGKHRRSSLRPMYAVPAPIAAPCPPGTPCDSAGAPQVQVQEEIPTSTGPALIDPGAGFSDSYTPEAPRAVSPPAPQSTEDSNLEEIPENTPRATPSRGPELSAPKTSLRRGKRIVPFRLRRASLRDELRPYVSDPDDLFLPPKADRPWRYVVLHHSASATGGYDQIDREHRKVLGWEGCGYHFVIGNGTGSPDGKIEVAQRWSNQKNGVHCRNGKHPDVNEYGIGICLVGDLDDSPPTPRQVAAARALVAYLGDRYSIPTDRIETHAHLANGPTACPGKLFPSAAIFGAESVTLR